MVLLCAWNPEQYFTPVKGGAALSPAPACCVLIKSIQAAVLPPVRVVPVKIADSTSLIMSIFMLFFIMDVNSASKSFKVSRASIFLPWTLKRSCQLMGVMTETVILILILSGQILSYLWSLRICGDQRKRNGSTMRRMTVTCGVDIAICYFGVLMLWWSIRGPTICLPKHVIILGEIVSKQKTVMIQSVTNAQRNFLL